MRNFEYDTVFRSVGVLAALLCFALLAGFSVIVISLKNCGNNKNGVTDPLTITEGLWAH
jgi:hypothetical protein